MDASKNLNVQGPKGSVARVKKWMCTNMAINVPSPFRKRAYSDERRNSDAKNSTVGCKSAPDQILFGKEFKHLRILRDVCHKNIGGNFVRHRISSDDYGSVSDGYSSVYGAHEDLNTEYATSNEDDGEMGDFKERKSLQNETGSNLEFHQDFQDNTAQYLLSPLHLHPCTAEPNDSSTEFTETGGSLTVSPGDSRPSSNKSCFNRRATLGLLSKQSFDELINENAEVKRNTEKEADMKATAPSSMSEDGQCRIKIGLQYFKNTRQLRVLLLRVELIKSMNCKIFVKLSLHTNTSKQKVSSCKLRCSSSTVELNEVLYIEQQDGWTNGKFLKVRLCKETKFVRRIQPIGEAMIALDDLDISSDVSMWLILRKHKAVEMASSEFEIVSETECSQENTRRPLLNDKALADSDIKLLLENARAYFHDKDIQNN